MAKRPSSALKKDPTRQVIKNIAGNDVVAAFKPIISKTEPNPEYTRKELSDVSPQYELISDVIAGSIAVKAKGEVYLPKPDQATPDRYKAYITRAVFYNVGKRTLAGLVGQAFAKPAVVKLPSLLDIVEKDATGGGVSLSQLAKDAETYVLGFGRAGMLTDYPVIEGATTRLDQINGNIRPTITVYDPRDCINWRTITRKSRVILSLVVLREMYDVEDDGFGSKQNKQYRVLRLVDDEYVVEIWRKTGGSWQHTVHYPRIGGKPLNEIPFTFIGSINNDASIDPAPMYDLCELNIAHYRNSADHEEMLYMVGQATPVFTGLTESWVEQVLKGVVQLGSRAAIPLPVGATAELLQMTGDGALKEEMEHKEAQMVALGAKLVQDKAVQRTATEANIDNASETSVLSTVTQNVSSAMKWSLEWCAIFMGVVGLDADARSKAVDYALSTDFVITSMSSEDVTSTITAWKDNAITFTEMREALHKTGVATLTVKEAKAELKTDQEEAMKLSGIDEFGNPIVDPNDPDKTIPGEDDE